MECQSNQSNGLRTRWLWLWGPCPVTVAKIQSKSTKEECQSNNETYVNFEIIMLAVHIFCAHLYLFIYLKQKNLFPVLFNALFLSNVINVYVLCMSKAKDDLPLRDIGNYIITNVLLFLFRREKKRKLLSRVFFSLFHPLILKFDMFFLIKENFSLSA